MLGVKDRFKIGSRWKIILNRISKRYTVNFWLFGSRFIRTYYIFIIFIGSKNLQNLEILWLCIKKYKSSWTTWTAAEKSASRLAFQRFKMNFVTLNRLELPIIRFIELSLFFKIHLEPLFPPTTTYQEPFWAVTRSPI